MISEPSLDIKVLEDGDIECYLVGQDNLEDAPRLVELEFAISTGRAKRCELGGSYRYKFPDNDLEITLSRLPKQEPITFLWGEKTAEPWFCEVDGLRNHTGQRCAYIPTQTKVMLSNLFGKAGPITIEWNGRSFKLPGVRLNPALHVYRDRRSADPHSGDARDGAKPSRGPAAFPRNYVEYYFPISMISAKFYEDGAVCIKRRGKQKALFHEKVDWGVEEFEKFLNLKDTSGRRRLVEPGGSQMGERHGLDQA